MTPIINLYHVTYKLLLNECVLDSPDYVICGPSEKCKTRTRVGGEEVNAFFSRGYCLNPWRTGELKA